MRNLQVTSIRQEGAGDYLRFGYGKATPIHHIGPDGGQSFAPTVLQEIGAQGHNLRLTWAARSIARSAEAGLAPAWAYGVGSIEDHDPDSPHGRITTHELTTDGGGNPDLILKLVAIPGAPASPVIGGSEAHKRPTDSFSGGLKGGSDLGSLLNDRMARINRETAQRTTALQTMMRDDHQRYEADRRAREAQRATMTRLLADQAAAQRAGEAERRRARLHMERIKQDSMAKMRRMQLARQRLQEAQAVERREKEQKELDDALAQAQEELDQLEQELANS